MAEVPALKQAFADGADIHNLTAQELLGEVNRDTRGRAKTINYAILYGISAFGRAGRPGCNRGEAQAIIDRYFDGIHGITNNNADTPSGAPDGAYSQNLERKTRTSGNS